MRPVWFFIGRISRGFFLSVSLSCRQVGWNSSNQIFIMSRLRKKTFFGKFIQCSASKVDYYSSRSSKRNGKQNEVGWNCCYKMFLFSTFALLPSTWASLSIIFFISCLIYSEFAFSSAADMKTIRWNITMKRERRGRRSHHIQAKHASLHFWACLSLAFLTSTTAAEAECWLPR